MLTLSIDQAVARLRARAADHQPQAVDRRLPQAAVLVGLQPREGELHLILVRRALHLAMHPGESAFPGGKLDPADDSLLAAALREADEEIGLSTAAVEPVLALNDQVTRTEFKVSPFVALVQADVPMRPDPREIDSIFTVPLSFVTQPENLQYRSMLIHDQPIRVLAYQYGEHVIWGVTARIIVDLVNAVFDVGLGD